MFELTRQLIAAGAVSGQEFSVDPRPVDQNVPANFEQPHFVQTVQSGAV